MKIGNIITPYPNRVLRSVYESAPKDGHVLDVGCLGFRQMEITRRLGLRNMHHWGVDYCRPEVVPVGMTFSKADLNRVGIPFPDDMFDVVISSHIIEHIEKPLDFFRELVRVTAPGGLIYLEAPSERSLMLPGAFFGYEYFPSMSFWDDPTHCSRPWTPAAFYRLAKYCSCDPVKVGHLSSWLHRMISPVTIPLGILLRHRLLWWCVWKVVGWECFAVIRKPDSIKGKPELSYYYEKD